MFSDENSSKIIKRAKVIEKILKQLTPERVKIAKTKNQKVDQLQKVKEYYKEFDKFYQHWGGNFQYPILKLSSWKYQIIYGEKG